MVVSHARGSVLAEKTMEANIMPLPFSRCAVHSMHWSMGLLSQNPWLQDGRKKNLATGGVKLSNDRLLEPVGAEDHDLYHESLEFIRFTMNTVRNSRK